MTSSTTIILVLCSALAWGLLDVARKVFGEKHSPLFIAFLLTIGQLPAFIAWALIESPELKSTLYFAPGILLVVLHTLASIAFIRAVSIAPLSETIPLLAISPVISTLLALTVGEIPSWLEMLGISMIVIGIFFVSSNKAREGTLFRTAQNLLFNRGGVLMLGVGVCWGTTIFLDKISLRYADPSFHGLFVTATMTIALGAIARVRKVSGFTAQTLAQPTLLLLPSISAVAFILQLIAIQTFPVGAFEASKRGIGVILSLFFGSLFFAEAITIRKVSAACLLVVGIYLVLNPTVLF